MSNMNITNIRGWTQERAKDNQFMSLIRHKPWYLYGSLIFTMNESFHSERIWR
jgi:hypothetical protein